MDFKLTFVQFLHKNLGNYEVKNYSQVELESHAYGFAEYRAAVSSNNFIEYCVSNVTLNRAIL